MKRILILITILLLSRQCWAKSDEVSKVITKIVTLKKYSPDSLYLQKIDSIKSTVILNTGNSFRINDLQKNEIKKSIKNIQFKIVENLGITIDQKSMYMVACYVNTDLYQIYGLKAKNYIFIDKDKMYDEKIDNVIIHELYHYIDNLIGKNGFYSDKVNFKSYIDTTTTTQVFKFVALLNPKIIYSDSLVISNETLLLSYSLLNIMNMHSPYFSSNHELYARYQTMKYDMVRMNIISKLSDNISDYEIRQFITRKNIIEDYLNYGMPEYLPVLIYLNWNKISDLDDLLR